MATIITKFSDYTINSIDYFISRIKAELAIRDLKGLTNNRVQMINVSKSHPLATLMGAMLQNSGADIWRSNIVPGIAVTPGANGEKGFTLGHAYAFEVVDDTFIEYLDELDELTDAEIQDDVLITKGQIALIKAAYVDIETNILRCARTEWRRSEELHISLWADSPDVDILVSNLLDSILSEIQVGFGSEDKIRDMDVKMVRGLTNFNFGRVLYGSEYTVSFLNTFKNYNIFTDIEITSGEFEGEFIIPGGGS